MILIAGWSLLLMLGSALSDSTAVTEKSNTQIFGTMQIEVLRLIPIFVSLSLLFFVYSWSCRLIGGFWALIPASLLASSPAFIAYGHLFRQEIFKCAGVMVFSFCLIELIVNSRKMYLNKNLIKLVVYPLLSVLLLFIYAQIYGVGSLENLVNTRNWLDFKLNWAVKENLPTLFLLFFILIFALKNIARSFGDARENLKNYITVNPSESLIMFLISLYSLISISRGEISSEDNLTISILVYILLGAGIKHFIRSDSQRSRPRTQIAVALIGFSAANMLIIYPAFNSHLNSIVLLKPAIEKSLAANYDLGTDLKRLKAFSDSLPGSNIGLDYYGESDPEDYLGERYIKWTSRMNAPEGIHLDYLAISAKKLKLAEESDNIEDKYLWLKKTGEPDIKIGSIWIYKLTSE